MKVMFLLFIVITSVGPIIWVFISSFKTNSEIMTSVIGFPSGLKFKNYVNAFSMAPLTQFYMNSVIISIVATFLNVAVFSMAGYIMSKADFKMKKLVIILFSLPIMVPGVALLQPLYSTLNWVHLYNTRTGLIIVYAAFGLTTTFYIMTSYFRTIPSSLEEAAYIDGSGFVRTFVQIVLPLAKPALATVTILEFLLCWNEFQFALTLTTGNSKRTLPIALYYFKSAFASDYGAMFAATILVIIPSITVYILLQKQIISGLASGSVKS